MERLLRITFFVILELTITQNAKAFEDPTQGRPFWPWVWEDQVVPTLHAARQPDSLLLLSTGIAATAVSFRYDDRVRAEYGGQRRMSPDLSAFGSLISSGPPTIGLAALQIAYDQANGLAHARALSLTAANHITIALLSQRERPNGKDRLSFPSGHNSSLFATATSLAYSYGWWIGAPAFGVAAFASAARLADDAHWLSDTVAGMAIGIYWGRASAQSEKYRSPTTNESSARVFPTPLPGGGLVVVQWFI